MSSPAGEKTEAATPRRREELRKRGQVARSGEVSAAAGLIAGLVAMRFMSGSIVSNLREFFATAFSRAGSVDVLTSGELQSNALYILLVVGKILGPILLAICVGGVVGGTSQVGFMLTGQPIKPQWNRLNVLQGIARIFSLQGAAQFAKSLLKAAIIGTIIFSFMRANLPQVIDLSKMELLQMGGVLGHLMWGLLIRTAIALAIIAAFDYAFQRFQFERSNRMSKNEVKEEYKRTEGDPMVKARRRQRQREIARQRMMQAVRKATVVVTNPTHIAVALLYEPNKMSAPQVVAKGERLIAQRIKEIAKESRVPIVENKPLARALHKAVRIGEHVPAELYQAVAEVLAFVYRLSGRAEYVGAERN